MQHFSGEEYALILLYIILDYSYFSQIHYMFRVIKNYKEGCQFTTAIRNTKPNDTSTAAPSISLIHAGVQVPRVHSAPRVSSTTASATVCHPRHFQGTEGVYLSSVPSHKSW